MSEEKKLILIDGSGFLFRAYHSLPPLTRPDGTPVGAVYGFTNMLLKLRTEMHASHMAVIFDAARKTFRNAIYPAYKANRPEAPEDLIPQFSLVREAARALSLPAIEMESFEADDIIACYAAEAKKQGMEVVIVSSDKDLMQLVGEGVTMYDAMKNKAIGVEQVHEKFGVGPERVVDVQALAGDSSDNVPGVPGIGIKTAAELINQYGSLEALLEQAASIKQPKRRENLIAFAEQARISRQLVTLSLDCEGLDGVDALTLKPLDTAVLQAFLAENNFTSLASRVKNTFGGEIAPAPTTKPHAPKTDYRLVQDIQTLKDWIARATATGAVAFDTETTGLDAMTADLVGFSLSVEAGKACYVPLAHKIKGEEPASDLFGQIATPPSGGELTVQSENLTQIPLEHALALIKPLLEDEAVLKIGQNIKYDMLVLRRYGVRITPIGDTMLLSCCLAAGAHAHNMDELSERHLGIKPVAFKEVTGSGKSHITFDYVPLEEACRYAAEDADITLRLWQHLQPQLISEKLVAVYERFERPLIPVLVAMEAAGVKVDTARLRTLSGEFAVEIRQLEEEIHRLAGHPFTIGSPKQLGEVLYDEMQLPGGKKSSKSGAYATGAEILEELAAAGHALPEKVLEWRQISKLKSTYTDTLVKQVNPQTGRVHTSYGMAIASTGRLSSTDPNLQNIPIRSERGRKIREAFIAPEGYILLSADYSQIELRLLAHVADIAPLKQAFAEGRDIHAATASQMFGMPVNAVDAEARRKAKTINFGIIYGISAHGLAVRLGIGRKQAADYIEAYFAQYPGIRAYMEARKEEAREKGYVTTLWGRRCHIPGIRDKNPARRAFSERAAINAPLQGSAADIIKRAMIDMHRLLIEGGYATRMLLQVHDELVFELKDGEESLIPLIQKTMERAADLSVPLRVETGSGSHWGAAH